MPIKLGRRQPLVPRCSICGAVRRALGHTKSMKNGAYLWCDKCDVADDPGPFDVDRIMREGPNA